MSKSIANWAVSSTIINLIGNTPLLDLSKTAVLHGVRPTVKLFAKAEWFNPTGSVKDRPAFNIVQTALENGQLKRGQTLLDSTSGNMGIAYAMIGAALNIPIQLTVPANASPERLAILRAYGADVRLTDPLEGSDGAIREARKLAKENPDLYYANQYNNQANWEAHFKTTGVEIWEQTEGRITHFVAGLGTSGTFIGTTRRLKQLNPEIEAISMQPDSPFNGLEGLKHMETAIKPAIYDETVADQNLTVRTEVAQQFTVSLARNEGIFVGTSAGAAVAAAVEVAGQLTDGVVVTILPDSGFKYLSEQYWR